MTKTLLAVSLSAILAISVLAFPLGVVDAMGDFLDVKKAKVVTDSSEFEKLKFKTKGEIPTDGTGGAFGYGAVVGEQGDGSLVVAVTTTHPGVLDSVAQQDANDPVFHNHYVALWDSATKGTGLCPGLEVKEITFQEPGDVDIENKKANMEDVPYYFSGTHSLTGDVISYNAGEVGLAVSFTIDPVPSPATLQAVCINDVAPASELEFKEKND